MKKLTEREKKKRKRDIERKKDIERVFTSNNKTNSLDFLNDK